jgi:tetratricopeptide (TPR) repeat protein
MGDICAIQFDYKESLTKYIKAKEYFILAGDKVNAAYKIIDMGRIYRCLKEYNKAQGYYKQALSQTSDSLLQGTAYQEIGINYYYAYQYDSAMYFLKQSIHFPYKGTNFAIRCNLLADLFFDRAQYDSAFHYAIQALKYPTTFYNKRDVYRILANTEYSRGNLKQMAIYISKYQDYTDSVRKIESQSKLKAIENIHNTTKEANTTKRNMVLIVSVLIIILLLSSLLVFYLYKRNNLKRKQLNTFKLQLNNKQEFLSRGIQNKIEDIKALKADERKNASADERIKLDKELYINVLHLDKWDDFSREMNHAFNNIVVKLITDYPTITQKEVIWCCLHLLDIPHADRMLLLDVSSDSLYKLKQRFARKLNLKSTKDLDLFLRNLIEIKE